MRDSPIVFNLSLSFLGLAREMRSFFSIVTISVVVVVNLSSK